MTAPEDVRAVLFDLDGTLYHQPLLRSFMALELAGRLLRAPAAGREEIRALRSFRRIREELRASAGSLDERQYRLSAERAGLPTDRMRAIVDEWIHSRPLRHLRRCRRRGLLDLLQRLDARAIRAGVFSDYPAERKLEALDVSRRFSPTLCATDPEIDAFKPDPRGFRRACALWGLPPGQVLYVGDRPHVDAAGAEAAGMPCAILTSRLKLRRGKRPTFIQLSSFADLGNAIDRHG